MNSALCPHSIYELHVDLTIRDLYTILRTNNYYIPIEH